MNFNKDNQIFINKYCGELMNFYIKEKSIYYRKICDDMQIEDIKLIDKVKMYDVTLDSKDNIHLICVTDEGKLYYFIKSDIKLEKIILKKFGSKANSIDFISIAVINNIVHIFYSFKNILDNDILKIIHLCKKGLNWKINYLQSVPLLENRLPYLMDYASNGDIVLLFKMQNNSKLELYLRIYSHIYRKWENTIKINLSVNNINITNLFIDSKDNIHIIYECKENTNSVYYSFENIKNLYKDNKWREYTLIKSEEPIMYKFFEVEEKLWIIWRTKDYIHYKSSADYGKNWTENKIHTIDDITNIHYIGSKYKDISILKSIKTFGNINENSMYLVGLDKNIQICEENTTEENAYEKGVKTEDINHEEDLEKVIDEKMHFRTKKEDIEELIEDKKQTVLEKIKGYFNSK